MINNSALLIDRMLLLLMVILKLSVTPQTLNELGVGAMICRLLLCVCAFAFRNIVPKKRMTIGNVIR